MKDLVIIGSGGHSRAVISVVKLLKSWSQVSVIDIKYSGDCEKILGIPVVGGMEIIDKINIESTDIFIAIGDNFQRKEMMNLVSKKGFKLPNLIHESAILDQDIMLGYGNFIGPGSNLGPGVKIGNGNIINTQANLDHESRIGNYNQISPSAVLCGRSVIGNSTWLGANSTVINDIEIADDIIIGAGSVVIRSIFESGVKLVGIPARKI